MYSLSTQKLHARTRTRLQTQLTRFEHYVCMDKKGKLLVFCILCLFHIYPMVVEKRAMMAPIIWTRQIVVKHRKAAQRQAPGFNDYIKRRDMCVHVMFVVIKS